MPVNVYETSGAVVVVAPLPAVRAEDVTIEVHPRPGGRAQLRFWAHLRSAAPRNYLVHEWDYGGYEREVDLPDGLRRVGRGVARQRPAGGPRAAGPRRRALTTKPIAG